MNPCDRLNCIMDGVWNPILVVWAPNYQGAPTRVWVNLNICELHRKQIRLEDLLTDTLWAMVEDSLVRMGKVRPDRRLTNLEFQKAVDGIFKSGGPTTGGIRGA